MTQNSERLAGPPVNPEFAEALGELVAVARQGHRPESLLCNPPDEWLIQQMPVFQDLPADEQQRIREETEQIHEESRSANAEGKAAYRAGSEVVFQLDNRSCDCIFSKFRRAAVTDRCHFKIEPR